MSRILEPGQVFEDDVGRPLSGGSVTTYNSGTVTLKASYSDSALTVQNPNPMIIGLDGRLVVDVWGAGLYTIRVADVNGAVIWSEDEVGPPTADDISYDSGTVDDRTVEDRLRDRYSFKDFGAVAGGVTDDTAAVNAAIASGFEIDGLGLTYAVSGNISLLNNTSIHNAKFIQLSPDSVNCRTLYGNNKNNIRLINVTVDRNGDGTGGGLDTAAGIWIEGGSGHTIQAEVFGDDLGSGIRLDGCEDSKLYAYVHDMAFDNSSASDDQLMGVFLVDCVNVQVESPLIKDLTGNVTSRPNRYTRGIALGGCVSCTINNPLIDGCDQGIDITGDGTPGYQRFISVNGGIVKNCEAYGVKLANVAQHCVVTGVIAQDCGYAGFIVSGGSASGEQNHSNTIIGCKAYNTGSNGFWSANDPKGFFVITAGDTNYPRDIRIIGCSAYDSGSDMIYGALNQTVASSGHLNILTDFHSVGHVTAVSSGFHTRAARAYQNSAQSIPDSTYTDLAFDLEALDNSAAHDTVTTNNRFYANEAGTYYVNAQVAFAANTTGRRKVKLLKNAVDISRTEVDRTASGSGTTPVATAALVSLAAGDYITAAVYQSSTGSLDTDVGGTSLDFFRVN